MQELAQARTIEPVTVRGVTVTLPTETLPYGHMTRRVILDRLADDKGRYVENDALQMIRSHRFFSGSGKVRVAEVTPEILGVKRRLTCYRQLVEFVEELPGFDLLPPQVMVSYWLLNRREENGSWLWAVMRPRLARTARERILGVGSLNGRQTLATAVADDRSVYSWNPTTRFLIAVRD